jgi:hypothetical protein
MTFQISLFSAGCIGSVADAHSYSKVVPIPENWEKASCSDAFGGFSQPKVGAESQSLSWEHSPHPARRAGRTIREFL